MAQNTSDLINYFLAIDEQHIDFLGKIRHWDNLKIGTEDNLYWVKNLSYEQIDSLEVKTIPFKTIYYAQENKLFKQGSLLPERTIPTLLWTPIERGLSIELPNYNFNYFGINEKVEIKLVESDSEKPVVGMLVKKHILEAYIQHAPAIRFQKLEWVIINDESIFIVGEPNLPIQGDIFWKINNFFLPIGYAFEFPILINIIAKTINPTSQNYIIYYTQNDYYLINKYDFQPLSISSFRLSFYNL
ncbi:MULTISPECIES: hypothetical protein [unclassified Arcicella]|uniref:hypothetical protein n=1 Tax=unclassified Arcicella TaxID=2644986 RepID=UPI002861C814|nr:MULTISPECIES: hypothetical protein [unclassified Arcicella]MDR6560787.1 hypothetical protein [Arcicella sp. BE51]MDR6810671.1 hypothetical protein [Arcicella sp. BE140]MDR6822021.1 hypothetical protein [Arcicella sp. BE139]